MEEIIYIKHHGIKGQKWGVRRYQNEDGSYKPGSEGRYYKKNNLKQQFNDVREKLKNNSDELYNRNKRYEKEKKEYENKMAKDKGYKSYDDAYKEMRKNIDSNEEYSNKIGKDLIEIDEEIYNKITKSFYEDIDNIDKKGCEIGEKFIKNIIKDTNLDKVTYKDLLKITNSKYDDPDINKIWVTIRKHSKNIEYNNDDPINDSYLKLKGAD